MKRLDLLLSIIIISQLKPSNLPYQWAKFNIIVKFHKNNMRASLNIHQSRLKINREPFCLWQILAGTCVYKNGVGIWSGHFPHFLLQIEHHRLNYSGAGK